MAYLKSNITDQFERGIEDMVRLVLDGKRKQASAGLKFTARYNKDGDFEMKAIQTGTDVTETIIVGEE